MLQALPGFRDFYPEDCRFRNFIFNTWRKAAVSFNFQEYDTPILEELALFTQKSGEEIIGQLFCFTDKGGRQIALRPETTPALVRLLGAKFHSLPKPIKWFTIGEQFRYERPQKGRLRSFYQFNADIVGEASIAADAECIALLIYTLEAFGLCAQQVQVRLSDRKLWWYCLQWLGIPEEKLLKVLGIIDKADLAKEGQLEQKLEALLGESTAGHLKIIQALLTIHSLAELEAFIEHLQASYSPASFSEALSLALKQRLEDWKALLAALTAYGLESFVVVDFSIVRGLAYYSGFVFEAFDTSQASRALAGGGRYDELLQKLTGVDSPAVGWAMGDVTLLDLLQATDRLPKAIPKVDCYILALTPESTSQALKGTYRLRQQGYSVEVGYKPLTLAKHLKHAFSLHAQVAILYGKLEEAPEKIVVRDLHTRTEAIVLPEELLGTLQLYFEQAEK